MPDQLVVRRWARHGRRNAPLATGFGDDNPIRPATAGALRTPAPPASGTAASPATGTLPGALPGAFATAPWVAAAPSGTRGSAVPQIGQRSAGAPPIPASGRTAGPAPAACMPGAPPAAPGRGPLGAHRTGTPAGAAPESTAAPATFGGAWAPGPEQHLPLGGEPTTSVGVPGPGAGTPAAAPPSALLQTLPVAPPRTGTVTSTAPPAPASADGGAFSSPAAPTSFTAAEIERIRSGTGSLLERTAHLFAGSPGPAPAPQPDPSTGGSAVFHQTSTDGMAPALADPRHPMGDPWASGPPVPASALSADPAAPEDVEPSGATLDRIVDAVVERIEDRVIDELERRGRHEWRVV